MVMKENEDRKKKKTKQKNKTYPGQQIFSQQYKQCLSQSLLLFQYNECFWAIYNNLVTVTRLSDRMDGSRSQKALWNI